MIRGLYFSLFRFALSPKQVLHLPASNKGNVLRGALGVMLGHVFKSQPEARALYRKIFEPVPPPGAAALSNYKALPQPFVIEPPLSERAVYHSGEEVVFDVVFVGKAIDFRPYFQMAFDLLASHGFGLNRAPCRLARVDQLDAAHSEERCIHLFDQDGTTVATSTHSPPIRSESLPPLPQRSKIVVRFRTPTHLVFEEHTVAPEQLEFHHLLKRLRDRLNALATFYCGGPLKLDFAAIGERAEAVRTTRRDLRWEERARTSSLTGQRHEIGGFIGECEFEGELGEFLPLLQLGQYLHVGKHAAWGNGWLEIADSGLPAGGDKA